jgi:hypothetical protein
MNDREGSSFAQEPVDNPTRGEVTVAIGIGAGAAILTPVAA